MTVILGISALYHDSAASIVVDGQIIAAAQEERFTRIKHDSAFPRNAIDYCLKEAGLASEDIDHVAYYEKPLRKLERILETYLAFAPSGFNSFRKAIASWAGDKLFIRRKLRNLVNGNPNARTVFVAHHESHAASAFFPSPFENAAILTVDGVGEWATATWGFGKENQIRLEGRVNFPHSIGLLYSAFTYHCGFKVNSGEYKLMGLAPFGEPRYAQLIHDHLIKQNPDGSVWMDMQYFDYCAGLHMTNQRFSKLFGIPPRTPETEITIKYMDLAASVQQVTEDLLLQMVNQLRERTELDHLVLAGGVALNCVANGKILREGPFQNIWIQPAAGDAGGSLGAALFVWHQLLGNPRKPERAEDQKGSLLGPEFTQDEIHSELQGQKANYQTISDDNQLIREVAKLINQKQVIGWFQGRMEFGPRALGNRSILGDPRSARMQSTINTRIKFRESFRPFAPIVKAENATDWFDIDEDHDSPYMLIVAPVAQLRRKNNQHDDLPERQDLLRRVQQIRSEIPAVTHVDYSARLQTVDATKNPRLHKLLSEFHRLTGCPVLVNTSFNVRGEPIVCSPADAFRCFMATDMDVLVMGNTIVKKTDNPGVAEETYATELAID